MQKVIFDSSFLIAVVESPTTWLEDITEMVGRFEPVLLECVEEELRKLSGSRGRNLRPARVALELASEFTRVACGDGKVDDEVMSAALSTGSLVATADGELLKALRAVNIGVISLRRGRVKLD